MTIDRFPREEDPERGTERVVQYLLEEIKRLKTEVELLRDRLGEQGRVMDKHFWNERLKKESSHGATV